VEVRREGLVLEVIVGVVEHEGRSHARCSDGQDEQRVR
jgi:hypothetical protein